MTCAFDYTAFENNTFDVCSPAIVKTWTLRTRSTVWTLDDRGIAWTIINRLTAWALDDRSAAWTIRTRSTDWSLKDDDR